jgi:hypothetical protein
MKRNRLGVTVHDRVEAYVDHSKTQGRPSHKKDALPSAPYRRRIGAGGSTRSAPWFEPIA